MSGSNSVPSSEPPISLTRREAVFLGLLAGSAGSLPTARARAITDPDDVESIAKEIASTYSDLFSKLKALDFETSLELARTGSDQVAQLQSMLDDPLWVIAQWIPVYGEDVSAVRTLASVLSDVTDRAIVPLCEHLVETPLMNLFRINDYGNMDVDMTALKNLVDVIREALPSIRSCTEALEGIGELHIEQLDNVVNRAKLYIDPLSQKLDKYSALIELLPQILDDEGRERLYLVVAQNNVELRSIGGFAGAWCPVRVNRGTVMFGDVTNVYKVIPVNSEQRLEITDEEFRLFGISISYMAGNVGIIPDFPRVCDIWSQLWKLHQGSDVDGAIAMDPIFFQDVIGLIGGITMYDGTKVDGSNAASVLMHDVYWNNMDSASAMDQYFADVAGSAVRAIIRNFTSIDIKKLRKVLRKNIDRGDLVMWFADEEEQKALELFGATGALSYDEAEPILGVYLSNESYSKIDWWLDREIEVDEGTPNEDGSTTHTCSLSLTSTATWDEIDAANEYIYGGNPAKIDRDDMLYWVFLFAPAGGSIDSIEIEGQCELEPGNLYGLDVWFGRTHVQIEKPVEIRFITTTSPNAKTALVVRKTPVVQDIL